MKSARHPLQRTKWSGHHCGSTRAPHLLYMERVYPQEKHVCITESQGDLSPLLPFRPPPQPLSTQMLITALGEKTLRKTPCSEPPIPLWGLGWGHRTVGPMSPPFENFFSNGGRHFSHILSRGTFLCFEKNNSRNLPFVHFLGRYIQCPYLFGDRANRTKLLMFPCPKFSEGSFSKGHSIR